MSIIVIIIIMIIIIIIIIIINIIDNTANNSSDHSNSSNNSNNNNNSSSHRYRDPGYQHSTGIDGPDSDCNNNNNNNNNNTNDDDDDDQNDNDNNNSNNNHEHQNKQHQHHLQPPQQQPRMDMDLLEMSATKVTSSLAQVPGTEHLASRMMLMMNLVTIMGYGKVKLEKRLPPPIAEQHQLIEDDEADEPEGAAAAAPVVNHDARLQDEDGVVLEWTTQQVMEHPMFGQYVDHVKTKLTLADIGLNDWADFKVEEDGDDIEDWVQFLKGLSASAASTEAEAEADADEPEGAAAAAPVVNHDARLQDEDGVVLEWTTQQVMEHPMFGQYVDHVKTKLTLADIGLNDWADFKVEEDGDDIEDWVQFLKGLSASAASTEAEAEADATISWTPAQVLNHPMYKEYVNHLKARFPSAMDWGGLESWDDFEFGEDDDTDDWNHFVTTGSFITGAELEVESHLSCTAAMVENKGVAIDAGVELEVESHLTWTAAMIENHPSYKQYFEQLQTKVSLEELVLQSWSDFKVGMVDLAEDVNDWVAFLKELNPATSEVVAFVEATVPTQATDNVTAAAAAAASDSDSNDSNSSGGSSSDSDGNVKVRAKAANAASKAVEQLVASRTGAPRAKAPRAKDATAANVKGPMPPSAVRAPKAKASRGKAKGKLEEAGLPLVVLPGQKAINGYFTTR
jgi:hypothetical protein